jgi:prepilin-type N-terminal cleavage/methylation domain-containing protein
MRSKSRKGFTLVEVLLAVVLIGIALIPIMQVMPQFYRTNSEMIKENTISFLAQQKIEYVKGKLIDDINTTISPLSGTFNGELTDGANFHYLISAPVPDGSRTNFKVVTVQVWYGSAGSYGAATNKIQLTTKIASRA